MDTFGYKVRKLRIEANMPLRKLSALLDIDQSTLSKIELGERNPSADFIDKISVIFSVDKKDLRICYVSDKIVNDLLFEEYSHEILRLAAMKIDKLKANQDE